VSRGRKKLFIEHFEIILVIYYIKYISSGREMQMRYAVHLRNVTFLVLSEQRVCRGRLL
jgi:hypothetical protein